MLKTLIFLISTTFFIQGGFLTEEFGEKTIYFFCDSKLWDVSTEENHQVVVTGLYEMTVTSSQFNELIGQWDQYVNTAFQNDCGRTSNLNFYESKAQAEAQLDNHLLSYFRQANTTVNKVDFQFEVSD